MSVTALHELFVLNNQKLIFDDVRKMKIVRKISAPHLNKIRNRVPSFSLKISDQ